MKKRILLIGLSSAIMVATPIVVTSLSNLKWLIFAVTLICICGVVSLWSIHRETIRTGCSIIYGKIRNRLFGRMTQDKIIPLITEEQRQHIDNAIKISFTGDLILLREMVERAYDSASGQYEFDRMFEHVSDLWQKNDLAIGVFEGPMCGEEKDYSTSNFDDGIDLHLNFPDSFASAVKKAGINLVTLANNHIFDMGIEAGLRTLKILDNIGLDHVGLNADDQPHRPKIVTVKGKRIGILAYTYGQNGMGDDLFFNKETGHYLKPVLKPGSRYFKRNVAMVRDDFKRMREANPDMIIVLPHMGEQFRGKPDKTQRKWCDIFTALGADIIFSDHPHHVQPIEWRRGKDGKRVLIVHCPGNFINSYTGYDGDASMTVTAYLDSNSLEPFAIGVTPIYAHCPQNGQWTGLPTCKALTDGHIYNSLSRADFRRISRVNRLVTGIALNTPLDIDTAQPEYLSFANGGVVRQLSPHCSLYLSDNHRNNSLIARLINEAATICFVGDSVTEGTKNGGFGWYEPLMTLFPDKTVMRFAEGSRTSRWLADNKNRIADIKADLYVVAIGCNDIRYRDASICAMDAEQYISNIEELANTVLLATPESKFVFIAPWRSLSFDANFNVNGQHERMRIYADYTNALREYCHDKGYAFIDPNPFIFENMTKTTIRTKERIPVLKDFIHPDACSGILAYSRAVLMCGPNGIDEK